MGVGSLLSFMARLSLFPSKLAPSDIAPIEYECPPHVKHAEDQQSNLSESWMHQLLGSFHLDLAERLQQLQLHGNGNAHLNWLLDALSSTLSTHSSLHSALTAATASSNSGVALAKHRADEVLHMLDVCTSLKEAANDMDRYVGCLQRNLQSLGQALISNPCLSSSRLRAAAHRLSIKLFVEQTHAIVTGRHYRPLAEARSFLLLAAKSSYLQSASTPLDPVAALLYQALDGTLLSSLLALAAAVSSLEPPSPPRKCASTLISRVCKVLRKYLVAKRSCTPAWAAPLRQLCQDLREEEMSAGGSLFRELRGLQSAAIKLHATITTPNIHTIEVAEVKQSIESLGKSLREVHMCTSMLRTQLTSFFQTLIRLRLTLLSA